MDSNIVIASPSIKLDLSNNRISDSGILCLVVLEKIGTSFPRLELPSLPSFYLFARLSAYFT
jgi:hypothetical protein